MVKVRCPRCGSGVVRVDTLVPCQVVVDSSTDNIRDSQIGDRPLIEAEDVAVCEDCDHEAKLSRFIRGE